MYACMYVCIHTYIHTHTRTHTHTHTHMYIQGDVASGVVGIHLPRFKLFGEDVCAAARLESSGAPSRIHCSAETAQILREQGYTVEACGRKFLKGIGV